MRVVNDQIGCPNWSRAIAEATASVLKHISTPTHRCIVNEYSGIYHISGKGQTTWYEFAKIIVEKARDLSIDWASKQLKVRQVTPIVTSEFPSRAARPTYSVLHSKR